MTAFTKGEIKIYGEGGGQIMLCGWVH